jgi:hypothetical protein
MKVSAPRWVGLGLLGLELLTPGSNAIDMAGTLRSDPLSLSNFGWRRVPVLAWAPFHLSKGSRRCFRSWTLSGYANSTLGLYTADHVDQWARFFEPRLIPMAERFAEMRPDDGGQVEASVVV